MSYKWIEIVKYIDKEVAKGRTQDVLTEMHSDLDKQIRDLEYLKTNCTVCYCQNKMQWLTILLNGLFSIVKNMTRLWINTIWRII